MAAIPRLTGFLRAFSGEDGHETGVLINLAKKQKLRAEKQSQRGLTWTKLLNLLHRHSSASRSQVENELRELVRYATEIAGRENTSGMLESSAAFIFETFINTQSVGHKQTVKLRGLFGPFPASSATKACALVGRMVKNIPEDVIDNLVDSFESEENARSEFGQGIKFVYSQDVDDFSDDDITSESDEEEDAAMDFDFKYTMPAAAAPQGVKDHNEDEPGTGLWLVFQVENYFSHDSISVNEMASTILNLLKSAKTDDELQNELFDLLGFDRFEFIQSLFQHRPKLQKITVDSLNPEPQSRIIQAVKIPKDKRPNYGCQVTVETFEEKAMKKLMRKEEKKLSRKDGGQESEQNNDFFMDPQQLRAQREQALHQAMTAPLFSRAGKSGNFPEFEGYPYVFDQNIEARKSSAFISGTKMVLPEGFTRKTKETHEEVNIPPSDPPPTNVGKTLVPISSLDEIGQLAFQGMKTLNKIQSVVFATAYKTNENLLICAPTGAGKTNIAMLAVLHELKQHLSQGVIKKDEFKIVYVAPMKALAAEMVRNFGKRLEPLNIVVKELTGDMQLTKQEILKTQMLVTTPEKWDVVTRKSTGDVALTQLVKLLIIDEVHLLNDDRGPVIESLVARTLRQVESSQNMIRIVGLSATLPNYLDVARFLNVNPYTGLFFFDGRFRPVPLGMTFIGINSTNTVDMLHKMNRVCYDKVLEQVRRGEQVMVFVHARNETVRTAMLLREMAKNQGDISMFLAEQDPKYGDAMKQISKSRNKELREIFPDGFAIHHAGMLRQDRNLVEKYFSAGLVKTLVCTATLAWGVNLPAHAVIIKGTDLYDARKGSFVDLGILDVLQIFGRAGRPQFDKFGHATIITAQAKLAHYLSLLTRQNPIESQFTASLRDNLNAEISLGTVTNVDEAVKWLSYTYLFVRMRCNPLAYGLPYDALSKDPNLDNHRRDLIIIAGRALDKAEMIRFNERTGYMAATDLGRTASHFYIKYETMEVINEKFVPLMTEADVVGMVSHAQEFQQIKVRDEELEEMERHFHDDCHMTVGGGVENPHGKVNILLQTYISRGYVDGFSLVSDSAYVAQNAGRIVRALFEMALKKGMPIMAGRLLTLSKCIDKRLWGFEHPLRQFHILGPEILHKIEERRLTLSNLAEMDAKEIGHMVRHVRMGTVIKKCVSELPALSLEATIQPITRTVLRVRLMIVPEFTWNDRVHGNTSEAFWIWVEDPDHNHIYHSEYFVLQKKQVLKQEDQQLVFTIPIFEPLPTQYYVRAISDRWLGSEAMCPISFQHLILPERHPPHTDLLDLQPLPITALNDPFLESLYKFTHFNPVQTQIFHTVYHTDCNVLLGAPTGSGKTVAAEMAIFRIFREYPKSKAVYIAPLKALVRERMEDWRIRIQQKLGKKVIELTGDVTPDLRAISSADLIVTTPEKWDGISRSWQNRSYVKAVSVLIIDEIHLLGDDRGPVLEVIVSRTNFISSHTNKPVRVIGLSTALANARDLADWLGIKEVGLFNFRPSVRPVPLEAHIAGFPGKHYCPRMATMNKPAFQAIRTHSPEKPALIFVSSRRQTRLTALDLIAYLAAEDNPKQWMKMPEHEMENIITGIKDSNLKLTLAFGIGLHHAGLVERDRKTVEELYINQKIQVLIATATLAWGVNLPAHLVVIKGTEYFDGKLRRYVDFPITDVLQMMGRAGRPQFDDQGKAVILVHDVKKNFYKKFLYEPFPVESNLLEVLPEHLNAEIVAGTITSKQDAMDYITWTYFFRRLVMNPSFYNLDDTDHEQINRYLSNLVEKSLNDLESAYCCEIGEDSRSIEPLTLGRISSYYYLHHSSVRMFRDVLRPDSSIPDLIEILSNAHEYEELPVRHNEDQINSSLAEKLPLEVNPHSFDSPHTKANILFQAHFCRTQLPCTDYYTDTKSVLDQAIRILQAMLDVTADQGWLATALRIANLIQMVIQARWIHDSSLLTLPHIELYHLHCFKNPKDSSKGTKRPPMDCLPEVLAVVGDRFESLLNLLEDELSPSEIDEVFQVLLQLPIVGVDLSVKGWWEGEDECTRKVPMVKKGGRRQDSDWIQVHADQEYVLNIRLARKNKFKKRDSKAHTPRFPKVKDEGWFIILGEIETQDLIALKRIGYVRDKTNVQLSFYTPISVGRAIYTVYLFSDSYLGLDQQYDICLDVAPACLEAQVNTELQVEWDDLDFGDEDIDVDNA